MYENGKIRDFEIIPGMGREGDKGEQWRGINSTMICCKNL
jgi:hypothetical protein